MLMATAAMAQGGRVVRGVVLDTKNRPIQDATVMAVGAEDNIKTGKDGSFILTVPTYAREVEVSMEGYITATLEIDGSYLMFNLKIDSNYAKAKEQERIAAEKKAAEEAAAKAKAEEEARIAAEKAIEAERIAKEKEAAAKAKAEEEARIAAEKKAKAERIAKEKEAAAKAKAEEEARIAAEKKAEAERIAKEEEAAAKAKAEEEARIAAEKAIEAERIAKEKEATAKAKAEEKARKAAEKRAEEDRVAKEKMAIAEAKAIKREEYAKPIKGFESLVNFSYSMSTTESFAGIDYMCGYRFNNLFFLGAGVGANMRMAGLSDWVYAWQATELSRGIFYIPLYAHFRAHLINRRCAPFLALSAGYNISMPQTLNLELLPVEYNPSGAFVNPQIGVTYRIKPKLGIYLAAGFNASILPECVANTGYSATIEQKIKCSINVNLGISF